MSSLAHLVTAVAGVRLPAWSGVPDAGLLALQRELGELRRRVDLIAVEVAGEIARRSTREAGQSGLAQRLGARTPETLVQRLTGVSARDARQLVEVGRIDAASPVAAAVGSGRVGVAQAAAIRGGLGEPTERVSARVLASAAEALLARAGDTTPEELRTRAREARDELDAEEIAAREDALRERRYLHLYPQDDGMTRLAGLLDPESAAHIAAVVDAGTSPRRGGPRFVAERARTRAEAIVADPRTTEQIALDTVVAVLRAGATADPEILGPAGAPVQVLVSERDLVAGVGPARVEGQPVAVSVDSARRLACTGGLSPVVIDSLGRRVLDVGRTRRLFTAPQRRAISARDGGCLIPGCPCPPSWCEVHHVREWSRGGPTDVDDGVLLCRFHHLWMHNAGWRIERDTRGYRLHPPPGGPPHPRIDLLTKNPLIRRMAA